MSKIQLPALKPKRQAWNKGRLIGQKRPLLAKQVWAIRARLELAGNPRDLALFNLAIDSKLRGCDLVRLKVTDLVVSDRVRERVTVVQSKTQRLVQFEVSENTRDSIWKWVCRPEMLGCTFLFLSRFHHPTTHLNPAVCASGPGLGGRDWPRSERIRHALATAHQGRADLPENRQSARGAAFTRPHQGGQHSSILGCRTGRRTEYRRTDRHMRSMRAATAARHS